MSRGKTAQVPKVPDIGLVGEEKSKVLENYSSENVQDSGICPAPMKAYSVHCGPESDKKCNMLLLLGP